MFRSQIKEMGQARGARPSRLNTWGRGAPNLIGNAPNYIWRPRCHRARSLEKQAKEKEMLWICLLYKLTR